MDGYKSKSLKASFNLLLVYDPAEALLLAPQMKTSIIKTCLFTFLPRLGKLGR